MKAILIREVPEDVRKRFKVHCAQMGITMQEAFIRLMDLEVERGILFSPWTLNVKLEKKDKKGV